MKENKVEKIKTILFPIGVGLLSSFLTRSGMEKISKITMPPYAPPAWLFPIVWTILYLLMGVSAYYIKSSGSDSNKIAKALKIYYYQLAVNFLWPTLFFNFNKYLFSFFWLLLLLGLVIWMLWEFMKISKLSAYLNVPYLVWLIIAAYLNFGVWWLNRL